MGVGRAIVVTKEDDVFTITEKKNKVNLKRIDKLCGTKIKSFAYTYWHWAALSEDGRLFMWGNNHSEQLGYGSRSASSTPKLVLIADREESDPGRMWF